MMRHNEGRQRRKTDGKSREMADKYPARKEMT